MRPFTGVTRVDTRAPHAHRHTRCHQHMLVYTWFHAPGQQHTGGALVLKKAASCASSCAFHGRVPEDVGRVLAWWATDTHKAASPSCTRPKILSYGTTQHCPSWPLAPCPGPEISGSRDRATGWSPELLPHAAINGWRQQLSSCCKRCAKLRGHSIRSMDFHLHKQSDQ